MASFTQKSLDEIYCATNEINFIHVNKFAEYNKMVDNLVVAESHMDAAFPELAAETILIRISRGLQAAAALYLNREVVFSGFHCSNYDVNHLGWVLSHELTHCVSHIRGIIPSGEKATSLHAVTRIPLSFINNVSYLDIPEGTPSAIIKDLAVQAIRKRSEGYRTYIKWFEEEVKQWRGAAGAQL